MRVRDHLHGGARATHSGCRAASLGNLAHTAGCHEVCNADEGGDDGGGCGEDWEQCGELPKCVYWKSSIQPSQPYRHHQTNER